MIKKEFIKLFINITNINIKCAGSSDYYYPLSVVGLIELLMELETRNAIKVKLEAIWNTDNNKRSWLFYIFIVLCKWELLKINGKERKETVKEYFKEYKYDKEDNKQYQSTLIVKEKEIKFEIRKKEGVSKDILCFSC